MPPKFRGSKGLIGIIANEAARYSEFAACCLRLQTPPGWEIEYLIGGDWCGARNDLAKYTLDNDFTHLWFMDDDHAFAPDILMKLLRHDVPIVNPVCLTRTYPFQPVTYLEDGVLDLDSVPERGLVPLHAGGTAGMLIRRDVLEGTRISYTEEGEMIEDRWFEYGDESEDVVFCRKAKAAGFEIYADLEARLGHITTAVVWPSYSQEHGRWLTGLTVGKEMQIQIPLTTDLIEGEIKRVAVVPSDAEEDIEEQSESVVATAPPADFLAPDIHPSIAEPEPGAVTGEPCMICGKLAGWIDVHGRRGCAEHPEGHPAWLTQFERAEMWFKPEENRWYARILRGDGSVATQLAPTTQEAGMIEMIETNYPGLGLHQIQGELDDSRQDRSGPPSRLWSRGGTGGQG